MTVPDERMNALRRGRELLRSIADDSTLPTTHQSEALSLTHRYPSPSTLDRLLAAERSALPFEFAEVLLHSGHLFKELQVSGLGNTNLRRHLMYTLRHFPDELAIRSMTRGPLTWWLAPERHLR
jgi:hypothetical protein